MPTHYQTWSVVVIHGLEGRERHSEDVEVQVGPGDHVRVSMSVCVMIGGALCDMNIEDAETSDGYDLIVDVRRIR